MFRQTPLFCPLDGQVDAACNREALYRLYFSGALATLALAWAAAVASHWGYGCAGSRRDGHPRPRSDPRSSSDPRSDPRSVDRPCLAWPHAAVLLFLIGQVAMSACVLSSRELGSSFSFLSTLS